MFDSVDLKVDFNKLDQEILRYWSELGIPQRSFEKPPSRGHYVFFEGPPTANGKPGIHHVLTRAFKDLILRYKTMRGYQVGRRGGWDTHGLPVEVEVEKQIGSTGKQDIEEYGIEQFNKLCRDSTFQYIQDWNDLTARIGYWLDLDDAYITYTNSYIESCWWILKALWDRGLLYQDYKVTMHCPRCNSTLADHEASQGMREDVDDPSIWPKFPARRTFLEKSGLVEPGDSRPVFFLAWTTTPWTLPANTALAVRADAQYALVRAGRRQDENGQPEQLYVVSRDRAAATFGDSAHEILKTFEGSRLVGAAYDPILLGKLSADEDRDKIRRVIADESVTVDDGTGIVHIAPAYGDLEIGKKNDLPTVFSIDLNGQVYPEVELAGRPETRGRYQGLFFKEADKNITRDLWDAGLLYRAERILHAYPFCWRDDSPLIFYAKSSWYIRTTAVKARLLSNNLAVNWIPEHIKTGRFGRWLENNIDWAISRERYWGTPLPIWVSEDGEDQICVGSIQELERLTGSQLKEVDLHRPFIDEVTFTQNGKVYRRVPDTVDAWFDSGAMPYAQWHYPFADGQRLEQNFPADFICEAMDQTRGWFYSLHALATLLTDTGSESEGRPAGPLAEWAPDRSAYRNCMVLGFINDAQGQKMSKSRGNTVDPWEVVSSFGVDALRWYFYSSSSPDQNKNFDTADILQILRSFLLTLWNSYAFFVMYARLDQPDLTRELPFAQRSEADRWILSKLHTVIRGVTEALDNFEVLAASRRISDFVINDLSNWYVRRNRRRFWKSEDDDDKLSAYITLYEVLISTIKLVAPFAPFVSESIYLNLVLKVSPESPISVHLAEWPAYDETRVDARLLEQMETVTRIVGLGRSARARTGIKTRQPLSELAVSLPPGTDKSGIERFRNLLMEELNVKAIRFVDDRKELLSYKIRLNFGLLGPLLGSRLPQVRKLVEQMPAQQIVRNCQRKSPTRIEDDGETVELPPDSFLIDTESPDGYVACEDGAYLVALNTLVTEELELEGRARDLVRLIQNARKTAGFEISDRIRLGLQLPQSLRRAAENFQEYVKNEALVEHLQFESLSDPLHTEEVRVSGQPVTLTLERAKRANL